MIISRTYNKLHPNKDHTTYYNKYGEIVPSVTTVLKSINKDSLVYWANNLGWKRKSVKRELDLSSDIGTCAHNFIEAYIVNDLTEVNKMQRDIDLMPDELRIPILNSIQSFILFWKDNKNDFEIIDTELEMSCNDYGGTSDIIARYKNQLVILDLKTSKDFYFTMFLQLAAYAYMYKYNFNKMPKNVAIIRLDKYSGKKAEIKWVTDLPNSSIDLYYILYKRVLEMFKGIHLLEELWKNN